MRVFAVSGVHHSGKTTTIEHLIRELVGRGYSVGTVKSVHRERFSIDRAGTNTDRHRTAGATAVAARSDAQTAIKRADVHMTRSNARRLARAPRLHWMNWHFSTKASIYLMTC